jgi:hypothetical protein
MHTDAPNHVFIRMLAQDIALGGSALAWAECNQVNAQVVVEWTELPEFREFLEKCRIEYCERLVGKIAKYAERAIDRIVELSEQAEKPNVGLAAAKAIIEKWIALSVYFVQEQTYQSLNARMKVLVDAREAEKKKKNGTMWRAG